jgi:hypothetical protein
VFSGQPTRKRSLRHANARRCAAVTSLWRALTVFRKTHGARRDVGLAELDFPQPVLEVYQPTGDTNLQISNCRTSICFAGLLAPDFWLPLQYSVSVFLY